MKIIDLRYANSKNRVRISAKIIWEDCDRIPQEIYFETESAYSQINDPDPHAFIIASIFPALYFGESRLYIEEAICPKLRDGLNTAMRLLHHWWYSPNHKIVSIESKRIETVPTDRTPKRAAFCFSGGVDSMATLYHNHTEYPESHPGYLKDGLLVCGLEVQDVEQFQKVLKLIGTIAESSGLTFIPVYTNIIDLGPEDPKEYWRKFWLNEYMSASFAAIAHLFSKRWHSFGVNSSHDIPNIIPHGSNPLLTSCYSSWGLQIKEEGINFSRFEKVKMMANWGVALQNLRVCNKSRFYEEGMLNCGRCEKCIRTMLALEAADALKKSTAFSIRSITPQMVDEMKGIKKNLIPFYKELLLPLNQAGRSDLSKAVERKLSEYKKIQMKEKWKRQIKKFDEDFFCGAVTKIKQHFM